MTRMYLQDPVASDELTDESINLWPTAKARWAALAAGYPSIEDEATDRRILADDADHGPVLSR